MEENFIQCVAKMDGLFARSVSNGKQYLCQSKYLSDLNHLLLVATDCDKLWEVELSYNDLILYKEGQGLEDKEWNFYFDPFCSAFSADSITVELEGSGGSILNLSALCDDTAYTFRLKACTRNERKVEKLSNCVFSLFSKVQKQSEMEQELALLRAEIQQLREEQSDLNTSYSSDSKPSSKKSTAPVTNITKTNSKTAKRKPGYSLINPRVKRHVAKGAKIGE